MDKKAARLRRARRARATIERLRVPRLSVHRTPRHIYAQVIAPEGGKVVVSASTLDAAARKEMTYGGNVGAAKVIGRLIAERAIDAGIERVAFDRSGFKFHGRVKALADGAREAGLKF
jgi:large subunit ribosomal protein L18